MATTDKHLLLKRNKILNTLNPPSREKLLSAITAENVINNLTDGELIMGRYTDDSVKYNTLLAIREEKSNSANPYTIIDSTDINNRLDKIANSTVNGYKISTNPILSGSDIFLGSGYTKPTETDESALTITSADTVNTSIGKLSKTISDNEITIAASLNDLYRKSSAETNSRTEADNKILSLTVNEYPIADNPFLNGHDIFLDGYSRSTASTEAELTITSTDTVNKAFGKLAKTVADNEITAAGGLNDLNERLIYNQYIIGQMGTDYSANTATTYINAAEDMNNADVILDQQLKTVSDNVSANKIVAANGSGLNIITSSTGTNIEVSTIDCGEY